MASSRKFFDTVLSCRGREGSSRGLKAFTSVLLIAACFVGACSDTGEKPIRISDSEPASPSPSSKEQVLKELMVPQTGAEHATGPSDSQSSETVTERLCGYRTSGEYLVIPSKYYPEGVVVVTLPLDYEKRPEKSYPLVIAFGGAGECARLPRDNALAWMHYYKTDEAVETLWDNVLEATDFRDLVTKEQLRHFNERLRNCPYQGVILACPSSPPISDDFPLNSPLYEAFLMEEVIPSLQKHYRIALGRIGIDGVSMGGARSMYYGMKYPEMFASIGSVQGYFKKFMNTYRELAEENQEALRNRHIQLITSNRDSMARSVREMHDLLMEYDIPHAFLHLRGPHDYIFNQGPGSLALLLFHNEALGFEFGSGETHE